MPRQTLDDDETPRRRRGAKAVAIEAEAERGLALRVLLHSPKDMVAGVLAAAAVVAILTNALFLQAGRHPSPMFGGSVVTLPPPAPVAAVASPIPRPRPVEAARPVEPVVTEQPKPIETKPVEMKPAEAKPVEAKSSDTKPSDPMTSLVMKSTSAAPVAAPSNVLRPPAPIPTSNLNAAGKKIAAVQRALTEYGYGQLKPTGAIGADTQAAIAKFERARKLPVTGQMSDRLVHELTVMIGHPID
ncbi:peptidoglycan-binding protein [Bradyrhizobium sp. LTSPM299]|uniref:peptidoglycan-binding domain-containing protein n=1 Tax=Bradyrhizobium sp. LTSPM299 TaxID=1619233 RepID=UPI0005C86707|nr:peptidoglycan-binding domain-containing protein [Bradyrhizobium sp. LTSPM299]KJC62711.1 peptidoglycan-binding protein [Bradyrhizobium sp. LTSPM299]